MNGWAIFKGNFPTPFPNGESFTNVALTGPTDFVFDG